MGRRCAELAAPAGVASCVAPPRLRDSLRRCVLFFTSYASPPPTHHLLQPMTAEVNRRLNACLPLASPARSRSGSHFPSSIQFTCISGSQSVWLTSACLTSLGPAHLRLPPFTCISGSRFSTSISGLSLPASISNLQPPLSACIFARTRAVCRSRMCT